MPEDPVDRNALRHVYKVTLAVGAGAAAITGYLWYLDHKARREGRTMQVAPTVGSNYAGVGVAGRF